MQIYKEYIQKLINGLEDYVSGYENGHPNVQLEALRFLSDTADSLSLDACDEIEKIEKEFKDDEKEIEEASRGNY